MGQMSEGGGEGEGALAEGVNNLTLNVGAAEFSPVGPAPPCAPTPTTRTLLCPSACGRWMLGRERG
eukprot:1212731-Rhodomonas_salina.1